jgi:hypothetical protein
MKNLSRKHMSGIWRRYIPWLIRVESVVNLAQTKASQVRYEYFDFHHECKNMRWDRLSLLIDILEKDLVRQG